MTALLENSRITELHLEGNCFTQDEIYSLIPAKNTHNTLEANGVLEFYNDVRKSQLRIYFDPYEIEMTRSSTETANLNQLGEQNEQYSSNEDYTPPVQENNRSFKRYADRTGKSNSIL